MIDVRCKGCNRWLATATIMVAAIKCPRCKMIFEYKIFTNINLTNAIDPNTTYAMINPETKSPRSNTEQPPQ